MTSQPKRLVNRGHRTAAPKPDMRHTTLESHQACGRYQPADMQTQDTPHLASHSDTRTSQAWLLMLVLWHEIQWDAWISYPGREKKTAVIIFATTAFSFLQFFILLAGRIFSLSSKTPFLPEQSFCASFLFPLSSFYLCPKINFNILLSPVDLINSLAGAVKT